MHTVTRTYAVCTPRELKEHYPDKFQKEYESWARTHGNYYDWWEGTYNDLHETPHMYTPEVCAYFKNYPPTSWPDKSWPDELEQLVSKWTDVLSFTGKPVESFDLYPREIKLGDIRMDVRKFIKATDFSWDVPFALDALMQEIPTYPADIDLGEPLDEYFSDYRDLAEQFLLDTFCIPKAPVGYSDDARALAEQMSDCMQAIQGNIVTFIESVGEEVLRVLDAEYDHLQSEECFLEQDHLEIEVELETDDEQETIA